MRSKIALVLGGGGSRGLAHIGVLRVLQREQIPIDLIIGTSMGGIVGVFYALGYSIEQIEVGVRKAMGNDDVKSDPWRNISMLTAKSRQSHLHRQFSLLLEDKTFADLKIPLTLMAVDMVRGNEIQLCEGSLVPALLATSAMPGIFPPVYIDGLQLSDGGVISSLATPVAAEQGAETIIAVDVHPMLETEEPWNDPISYVTGIQLPNNIFNSGSDPGKPRVPNMAEAMWRSVLVRTWHLHQLRLKLSPPDVYMRPDVDQYGSLDFKDISGPIEAGEREAEKYISELRELVSNQQPVTSSQ